MGQHSHMVPGGASWDKANLCVVDQGWDDFMKAICQDTGEDFDVSVEQGYRSVAVALHSVSTRFWQNCYHRSMEMGPNDPTCSTSLKEALRKAATSSPVHL